MIQFTATSNIANKVRNTRLPRTKPLMPLFELISNSIHSIEEAYSKKITKLGEGSILIRCIRNGDPQILQSMSEIDEYPINSFEVIDNGIGLNEENLTAYIESDTDHKIAIGGKGVGRFVCLKAYIELSISSFYKEGSKVESIAFDFRLTKEGFHNFSNPKINGISHGTTVILKGVREEYQKTLPKDLFHIAREVVAHFQLYFIKKTIPKIIIRNQNNLEVNLLNVFESEFKAEVKSSKFKVADKNFEVFLTKSSEYQSHKIHFCAHNRSVQSEGLYSRIVDLGRKPIEEEDFKFFYQAHVVSEALDENVDTERIGFVFPDEDEDEESEDLNLAKIRKASILSIEGILSDYLNDVRQKKVESYIPIIDEEYPQYKSTLHYKREEVARLPPNLTKQELDIELYKILSLIHI